MMGIKDVGVVCSSCQWRNTGTSVECRNCRAALVTPDFDKDQWVDVQMSLRESLGLPTDDSVQSALQDWFSSLERSELGVSVKAPPPAPTVTTATSSGAVLPSQADTSEHPSADDLLSAILVLLRGFAMFLILSFVASFLCALGVSIGFVDGGAGFVFLLVGGLAGLAAIGGLALAWSASGKPFKQF